MNGEKPTYEELESRLAAAEGMLKAIKNEEIDSVIGKEGVYLLRLKEAEEALKKSEKKYRSAFANAAVGFALTTPDGRFIEANHTYCSITGYSLQELKTFDFKKLIHPDDVAENMRLNERLLSGRIAGFVIENRYVRKDGEFAWVRKSLSLVRNEKGEPEWLMALIEDITGRKRAEEESRYAAKMSQALNRINDVLHATLDIDQVTRKVVGEGAAALGSETAALSLRQDNGWTVWHVHGMQTSLIGERMEDTQEKHALHAILTCQPVMVEDGFNDERFNREHLRRYNIRAVMVVPLIIQGLPFGVIYFNYHTGPHTFTETEINFARQLGATASIALENARIFSDLEQAEKELLTLNKRLELAQNAAKAGTWDWDVDRGNIVWSNQMFTLFGLDPLKTTASFEAWRSVLHPDDLEIAEQRIDLALKERSFFNNDYRIILPSGEIRWINATGKGEYDEQGRPIRMIGICLDITERKQAEEALQKAHNGHEEKVKDRTFQLLQVNEQLKLEIEERRTTAEDLRNALTEIKELKDRHEAEKNYLQEEIKSEHNYINIVGNSEALRYTLYKVEKIAPTDTAVLVLGETGTGKELIARAIHDSGPRRHHAFVKVNCAT
ncbi:MAG: PAS domain-containing protein, partial [Desulfobacterales bacterium]